MKKLLIVYYSWSCGNTERTAKALQSVAGGDLVRLDTAVPYSGSYNDVVDQGQHEVNAGFEPELKPLPVNVADYDVIAVGTPSGGTRWPPPSRHSCMDRILQARPLSRL